MSTRFSSLQNSTRPSLDTRFRSKSAQPPDAAVIREVVLSLLSASHTFV